MLSRSVVPSDVPVRDAGHHPRDRFLNFAFASADMLMEVDPAGTVAFAAGAFRHYFGDMPEAFVGRSLAGLVAPESRGTLGMALQLLATRRRLPPTAIRLADEKRTAMAIAGLVPDGPEGQVCLTLSPMPVPLRENTLVSGVSFGRIAAGFTDRSDATLTLVDLSQEARTEVARQPGIGSALDAAVLAEAKGPAGRIVAGRYGILSEQAASDLPGLAARMEAVLLSHGLPGRVETRAIPLAPGELTQAQATQALRQALASFGAHGSRGLAEGGLTGALRQIAERARDVRRIIAERRFRMVYQPIMDLRTRQTHHYEALLRPEGIGVEELIRCVETIGLTCELDLAVTDHVLDALRFSPGVHIALNLSGLSVQDEGFRDALAARLDADPRLAARLLVELTESTEVEDEAAARGTFDMLRTRGVTLCLDDFGAGAASFRYLRQFPAHWIKIDGAYVRDAVRSERDRSFVASMVDLSLAVGVRVIAEQIETEAQADIMASLGVEMGQGYLLGRPGPLPGAATSLRCLA